eukprot:2382142-Amphidinium_carterae.1
MAPMLSKYDSNLACNLQHVLVETPEDHARVKLVLLLIGANDMSVIKGQEDKASTRNQEDFVSGYTRLLRMIRKRRPGVPIVSLVGDAASMSACDPCEQSWYASFLNTFIHEAHSQLGRDELCFVHTVSASGISAVDWTPCRHWSELAQHKWYMAIRDELCLTIGECQAAAVHGDTAGRTGSHSDKGHAENVLDNVYGLSAKGIANALHSVD